MKSIIQQGKIKECYLCREEAEEAGYYGELPHTGLHRHHFMHGTANRKKAEQYGLWAYVCIKRHHEYGPEAPHANAKVDRRLKRIAQKAFEKKYGHDLWMQEFGRNYLEEDEQDADSTSQSDSGEHESGGFFFLDTPAGNDL